VVTVKEASQLAGNYAPSPPAVLSGEFVVTFVNGRRVEMRTRESVREVSASPGKIGAVRIVVDYPAGTKVPELGATLSRDSAHGFVIRTVGRGSDGQVTILASEEAM
jgi:hypothetical protein